MVEHVTPEGMTFLQRFTVRPGHVEDWLPALEREMALRERHGFTSHRVFIETDAEPKVSWIYSHPDPIAGEAHMAADPEKDKVVIARAPFVFRNRVVRFVDVELLTHASPEETTPWGGTPARTVIMRRYDIVGSWSEFLKLWRDIVPLREKHGFRVLLGLADQERDVFTWAFDFDGSWEEFPACQRAYYDDPERQALRGVFDYMADYSIHPAICLS